MATLAGAEASQLLGDAPMDRAAARPKQLSLAPSSQTVAHSCGTATGCHPPDDVDAPMSRFHPPLTLTRAHRCIRKQFRSVQGETQPRAIATTASAEASRGPNRA